MPATNAIGLPAAQALVMVINPVAQAEGTETIPNGWSKRLHSIEAAAVLVKIQYRYRPNEYGAQLVRMYLLTNDETSQLGTSPLPVASPRVQAHFTLAQRLIV